MDKINVHTYGVEQALNLIDLLAARGYFREYCRSVQTIDRTKQDVKYNLNGNKNQTIGFWLYPDRRVYSLNKESRGSSYTEFIQNTLCRNDY